MEEITIKFNNGTPDRVFKEKGRAGGSYTISVRYEGAFVIVTDEWYNSIAFPVQDVKEVVTRANRGW